MPQKIIYSLPHAQLGVHGALKQKIKRTQKSNQTHLFTIASIPKCNFKPNGIFWQALQYVLKTHFSCQYQVLMLHRCIHGHKLLAEFNATLAITWYLIWIPKIPCYSLGNGHGVASHNKWKPLLGKIRQ